VELDMSIILKLRCGCREEETAPGSVSVFACDRHQNGEDVEKVLAMASAAIWTHGIVTVVDGGGCKWPLDD
jgi:hypothetical protein